MYKIKQLLICILFIFHFSSVASADESFETFGISKKNLDKLSLQETEKKISSKNTQYNFLGKDLEITLIATLMQNSKNARFLKDIEINAIKNSYLNRKNPYAGEITKLIRCDKNHELSTENLNWLNQKTEVLIGGASQRKVWGACRKQDIEFIGFSMFRFFEQKKKWVKLIGFKRFDKAKTWSEQKNALMKTIKTLISNEPQ